MVFVLGATAAMAAETVAVRYDTVTTTTTWKEDWHRPWCSYKGNEFNLSVFGSASFIDDKDRDGSLGLGVGLSYFFCRYVGVEAYAYSQDTHNAFVDNVGGDLVLRWPIADTGLAPYIFGGAARGIDPLYQWTYDGGAGLEWRFAPHIGVFVDGRYAFAEKTENFALCRFGMKFGF